MTFLADDLTKTFATAMASRGYAQAVRRAADIRLQSGVFAAFLRVILRLRAAHLRRQERAALRHLLAADNRMLCDIGLSRHDVAAMLDES